MLLMQYVLLLYIVAVQAMCSTIESFNFEEFYSRGTEIAAKLEKALTTNGVISVTHVPGFKELRANLLTGALVCGEYVSEKEYDFFMSTELADGTARNSFGFMLSEEFEENFTILYKIPQCSKFVSAYVQARSLIQYTSELFADWIDIVCNIDKFTTHHPIKMKLGENLFSVKELNKRGTQLHHAHVYNSVNAVQSSGSKALDFHVDHGLFLAFVPGFTFTSKDDMFYSKLNNEFILKAGDDHFIPEFPDEGDSLIFMLGDAIRTIVNPICKVDLVPTEHAVDLSLSEFPIRSWFGAMTLPPSNVEVPSSDESNLRNRIKQSFAQTLLNKEEINRVVSDEESSKNDLLGLIQSSNTDGVVLGCSRDLHLTELAKGGCKKGTMFCWMQCMPFTESLNPDTCASKNSETTKHELICANPDGKKYKGGMCTDCSLQCIEEKVEPKGSGGLFGPDPNFCSGLPSVMFMSGFLFNFEKRPNDACIVFLFAGFTADNVYKYWLVVGFCFLLGFCVELIVSIRREFQATGQLVIFKESFYSPESTATARTMSEKSYRYTFVALYFLQVVFGYFAMLIAMTYSTVLFLSVVSGLACGHFRYNYRAPVSSGEVCCQFLDDPENIEVKESIFRKKFDTENLETVEIESEETHLLLRKRRGEDREELIESESSAAALT